MSDRPVAPECRISRSASIEAELKRTAATEIEFALAEMRASARRPAHAVHQCRKAIKRVRALVRLGRGDADAGREIDRKLRDAGRLLAAARDADVIRKTAARLCADNTLSRSIDVGGGRAAAKPDRDVTRRVMEQLSDVRAEIEDYFDGRTRTPESLGAATDWTYGKAVRLMKRFGDRGGRRLAHAWRKSVQRYTNQLKLMADLWPERAAAELGPLDALAECLGEFNDLTILRVALEAGHIGSDGETRSALRKLARARQRALRQRALKLGESAFPSPGRRSAATPAGLEKDPPKSPVI
ncbi:MAG TPA: CHAD domain-containing protein [Gammaproteobacteria bacterium]|nr:CHAD domain-containing protein [Gammaproteobacteria bacterium]